MKRRQFGAMLTTATFSLAGVPGLSVAADDASVRQTEPLRATDVTVTVGGITTTVGRAILAFDDGTMTFRVRDVTMEGRGRAMAIQQARVVVEGVDAETFSTIRAAMVEAFSERSLSPLLAALVEVDIDRSANVQIRVSSVEMDGKLVFDRLTATGTVGSIVPEGARELLRDGVSVEEVAALGPAEFAKVSLLRGDTTLTLNDVTIRLEGTSISITSPGGKVTLPDGVMNIEDVSINVLPPETVPAAHVEFASRLRQLAAEESLSLPLIRSAAVESGVTVPNTVEAIRNVRFDLTLGNVTQDGRTVFANFGTSGTLAELLQVLRNQL